MRAADTFALAGVKTVVMTGFAFWATHLLTGGVAQYEEPARPPAVASPASILEEHAEDCWTGEAPEPGIIPTHVIWQHPDGTTVYSSDLVGPALDTIFGSGTLAGAPIAFCKE